MLIKKKKKKIQCRKLGFIKARRPSLFGDSCICRSVSSVCAPKSVDAAAL